MSFALLAEVDFMW